MKIPKSYTSICRITSIEQSLITMQILLDWGIIDGIIIEDEVKNIIRHLKKTSPPLGGDMGGEVPGLTYTVYLATC